MEKKTKIIIGASVALTAGIAAWYFLWFKKRNKTVTVEDAEVKIPATYEASPLVISVKEKADYIIGTLATMKLKNGVIVSVKSEHPYSIGLLQGVWRMHNEELDKLRGLVNNSSEPQGAKSAANKLIENALGHNDEMFDKNEYNYDAQWYKDYLAKV